MSGPPSCGPGVAELGFELGTSWTCPSVSSSREPGGPSSIQHGAASVVTEVKGPLSGKTSGYCLALCSLPGYIP